MRTMSWNLPSNPSGNWHEVDRAVLVFILVLAFALIRYLRIKHFLWKAFAVYAPTMLLVFVYVFLRGRTVALAGSAYRDVCINYTAGFVFLSVLIFVIRIFRKKRTTA